MILLRLLLCFVLFAPTLRAKEQPNFVFIIADDLGWGDVDFHGGNVTTPHLDRLRKEGVELRQHYVAPVCSPTRASLLTGRAWSRFGVTTPQNDLALPMGTVTLASALRSAGYETCLTGKWHLGSKPEWGPNHFGFDHSYGSLAGGVGPWNHFYKKGPFVQTWHRNEELMTEEGHVTDLICREAVNWIKSRGEKPFFLYVPFTAVHLPLKEPEAFLRRVPAGITGDVPRHYAASVLHLDEAVGQIIAAVEDSGKREETLIVFTSDNGGSTAENNDQNYPEDDYPKGRLTGNNHPLRGQKGQPYEGGTRVPTVVRWPGKIPAASVCDLPLHISDWMPTLCALAGHSPKGDLKWDGVNIWAALAGQGELPERSLYSVAPNFRSQVLRRGDWKLISHAGGANELYNIANDPSEAVDLSGQETEKLAEMLGHLAEAAKADRDATVPRPGNKE